MGKASQLWGLFFRLLHVAVKSPDPGQSLVLFPAPGLLIKAFLHIFFALIGYLVTALTFVSQETLLRER